MFDRVFLVSWILFFRILNFAFHIMIFVFHILNFHFVKSVQIRSFFWSVFSRIRTEYEEIVFLRIQSEFMKIRTRKNSVFGHFTRSVCFPYLEFCFFRSWILIFLNYGIFCVFSRAANVNSLKPRQDGTLCTIWYHLRNFKNVKNTHGVVLLLVKLQAEACNFTKSNTPSWEFFMFFKILQMVPWPRNFNIRQ